ncbi:hypothetical protein TNCT_313391 [Trichonephila clavata]|uniref:Uncharacterized protein n=1 Tax=Trichonephila clavata TaxID=2740835 RepID=A0A8X6H959_TRICU|nr:hypothetical protein TNCT_313391 [Trichonephila clavata]
MFSVHPFTYSGSYPSGQSCSSHWPGGGRGVSKKRTRGVTGKPRPSTLDRSDVTDDKDAPSSPCDQSYVPPSWRGGGIPVSSPFPN